MKKEDGIRSDGMMTSGARGVAAATKWMAAEAPDLRPSTQLGATSVTQWEASINRGSLARNRNVASRHRHHVAAPVPVVRERNQSPPIALDLCSSADDQRPNSSSSSSLSSPGSLLAPAWYPEAPGGPKKAIHPPPTGLEPVLPKERQSSLRQLEVVST